MYGEGLVHVVHGDVVPQRPQEVLRPRHRPADLQFQNEAQRKKTKEDDNILTHKSK